MLFRDAGAPAIVAARIPPRRSPMPPALLFALLLVAGVRAAAAADYAREER